MLLLAILGKQSLTKIGKLVFSPIVDIIGSKLIVLGIEVNLNFIRCQRIPLKTLIAMARNLNSI